MQTVLARELKSALEQQWSLAVDIVKLERLSAGASQELWQFDAVSDGVTTPLILRHPPADDIEPEYETALTATRSCEGALQQVLYDQGVKVPRVVLALGSEDTEVRVGGFIMERLSGQALPRRVLTDIAYRDARTRLPHQLAEAIAKIHKVPVTVLPRLLPLSASAQIRLFREIADRFGMRHPGFEWALRWLEENCPPDAPPMLVHGDFRLGNFIVDEKGLCGIIDWELAHLGDPVEDLAWLCLRSWRFSRPEFAAAGLTSRKVLVDAYEEFSGLKVDPDRLLFWEGLGNIKWAAICLMQVSRYLSNSEKHSGIENAAIGRRFDEAIYDFFQLIDSGEV